MTQYELGKGYSLRHSSKRITRILTVRIILTQDDFFLSFLPLLLLVSVPFLDSHEAPQEAIFKYCAILNDSAFHIAFFRALGSSVASGSQRPPKTNKNCPVNNSVMERF